MEASFGKITAVLAEPIDKISDELITLINKNIKPPEPVKADDVYVRAMFVVSDEINSFGGRFPADEHSRLSALLIDSPVLVGHRKDKLPIGRNFYAVLEHKQNRQWVKCYFYWLKSSGGAESLRENIDGGIYKECSIGFTYFFPECSVCGNDIRRCDHEPLRTSVVNGIESITHFNYRKIERVLETSLVYRGALPDTSVTKELDVSSTVHFADHKELSKINCRLEKIPNSDNARFIISGQNEIRSFVIRQFNLNRLNHQVRFLAMESLNPFPMNADNGICIAQGILTATEKVKSSFVIKLDGALAGNYILRPVKFGSERQWLFYKLPEKSDSIEQFETIRQ